MCVRERKRDEERERGERERVCVREREKETERERGERVCERDDRERGREREREGE